MTRRRIAVAAAVVSIAAAAYIGTFVARERRPTGWNLVLVSVDTLRADHLSCYGATAVRTPHMDRLASEGILFEKVSTVVPTTLPAHASLFTGLAPPSHGVRDNVGFYLDDRFTTLAEHLKGRGYDTAAFIGAFVLDSRFGLDRGFDLYDDDIEGSRDDRSGFVAQRRGAEVLESALAWLGSRGESSQPFFAFVHFYDPHTPYDSPEGYRGEVACVDSLVGKLLSFLDERGLTERTLVALTADHGESLGEHGELTHGLFLYESTLRIPLLIRYPGASAGSPVTEPMPITAVADRILEMLRLPPLPGGRPAEERPLYAETFVPRLHYGWSELRSLTRWPYKLVAAPRPELYDLAKDPKESENLFEKLPDVAKALSSELERLASPSVSPGTADGEALRKLEALGYVASTEPPAGELPDPKDRLEIYRVLNDPSIQSLRPEDGAAFEKALSDLKDVLLREPRIPRTYALYGELLLAANRTEEAAGVFQKLVALDPESFEGRFGLGVALQKLGRTEAAIESFQEAVRIDPRNAKTYLRLAEVDPLQAEAWLRRALAVHEDRVLVDRLAEVLASSGKTAEGLSLLEELARRHPKDPLASYNLGQMLLLTGQTEKALKELQRARELAPEEPDVHQALGSALALSGRREEALASFQKAVELSPCFAPALANLGAAYAELGRLAEAAPALEKAVSCDPSYAAGFKNLAAIRFQMGNLEGAVSAMQSAVRLAPADGELRAALKDLLQLQRRRKK